MTQALRFVPQVEEDLIAGHTWYESKPPGLGQDILGAFFACVHEIPRRALSWPMVHDSFRRCLLRRFPYAIYVTAGATEAIVFGVFHCARDPRAIHAGLEERNASDSG